MRVELGPKAAMKLRQRFGSSSVRLDINPYRLLNGSFPPFFSLPGLSSRVATDCGWIHSCLASLCAWSSSLRKAHLSSLFFLSDCRQKVSVLLSFDHTLVRKPLVTMETLGLGFVCKHHGLLKMICAESPWASGQGHCNIWFYCECSQDRHFKCELNSRPLIIIKKSSKDTKSIVSSAVSMSALRLSPPLTECTSLLAWHHHAAPL